MNEYYFNEVKLDVDVIISSALKISDQCSAANKSQYDDWLMRNTISNCPM